MIYIHEIDNDGRGANTWEVSHANNLLSSADSLDKAMPTAMYLARLLETTVTICPIEWYYKENQ